MLSFALASFCKHGQERCHEILKTSMKASQSSMKAVKAMKAPQKTPSSPMKSMKVLPSSSMKSMNVKKDAGNKDKNKGKKLSLEEKIEIWRRKNKDEASHTEAEPDLSDEEWQKANGRFKTAMNQNQIAQEAWETASNLGKGNVQKAKRQAMVAWLMDPSFGKGFQQYIQTVSYDQRHSTIEKPETSFLSAMMRRRLRPWWMLGKVSALVFLYLHCFKHKLSYLYTCQIYWSDEWHLYMFKFNHCLLLRTQGHWWNCQLLSQECKSTLTRACGKRAGPWPSL